MAYGKIVNSKATPHAAISYVLNPKKMECWGTVNMDESCGPNARNLARQMMETQHLFGKGYKASERKYYHPKISFSPDDRSENGGILTPELAGRFASDVAKRLFPGHEVFWGVHGDGVARHVHLVINAVNFETGKKIDMSMRDYQKFKDEVQRMCHEYGLEAGEWRESVEQKKLQESQSENPVIETPAEREIKFRGGRSWKEELRNIIDVAVSNSRSMEEFEQFLNERSVVLTRFSDSNISYKYMDHKACRGDTLGGDYTREAIGAAIANNRVTENVSPRKMGLDATIGRAERIREGASGRTISLEEREAYRTFGHVVGIKRSDIDEICNEAPLATSAERKQAWEKFKSENGWFWECYQREQFKLERRISDEYARLREVRAAEWALNPRNRKSSLLAAIRAFVFLSQTDSSQEIYQHIRSLRNTQRDLHRAVTEHKAVSDRVAGQLRQNLPLEEYLDAIDDMGQGVLKLYEAWYGAGTGEILDLRNLNKVARSRYMNGVKLSNRPDKFDGRDPDAR